MEEFGLFTPDYPRTGREAICKADRMADCGYHVIEPIGEGSFGRVYKGRRKYSSEVRLQTLILQLLAWPTAVHIWTSGTFPPLF